MVGPKGLCQSQLLYLSPEQLLQQKHCTSKTHNLTSPFEAKHFMQRKSSKYHLWQEKLLFSQWCIKNDTHSIFQNYFPGISIEFIGKNSKGNKKSYSVHSFKHYIFFNVPALWINYKLTIVSPLMELHIVATFQYCLPSRHTFDCLQLCPWTEGENMRDTQR